VKVFARIWLGSFKMAGNFSVGSYVHWTERTDSLCFSNDLWLRRVEK